MTPDERNLLFFPLVLLAENGKINVLSTNEFADIITRFIKDTAHQDSTFVLNACNSANFTEYLETSFPKFLANICGKLNFDECDVLIFGIACLYYFVQCNVTGPFVSTEENFILRYFLNDCDNNRVNEITRNINAYLSSGDELICCKTKEPFLLFLSKLVFLWIPNLKCRHWWLMRSYFIHQLLLDNPSPSIYRELVSLIKLVQEDVYSINDSTLKILFDLEKVQIYLQLYSEVSKSEPIINSLLQDLQLQAVLVGKLGKRTRYQHKDIAQLALSINMNEKFQPSFSACKCSLFPKDQRSNDDVRLPEIRFHEEEEKVSLSELQQAALLALFVLTKKSKPKDELQLEELSPYLTCLLADPQVWCIQTATLFFRSRLEAESSRTIERSITQIQSLISDSESDFPPVIERLPLLFCSFVQPKWKLELNLAKLLVEVGAIQSALDIYNHLQMWEEIVACYNYLKLRHKAAEIIHQEMNKQETVQLWCLLGDATDDLTCYQKAWELSKCKSSKAQKHWALYYFSRKQYEESIPHFRKSLEINSLQVPLWFNLGFAALIQEDWELSATAYRRYCSLEPDCFEAWNNLAKAYIKLGQKDRAWRALQDAVKCNYDNWKVWDNLMAVSTDCGDFNEVIRCYHRLLDIKGKHVDIEVLRIFVHAIRNNCIESDLPALKKDGLKLFGRLTSLVMNDAEVWKLYASLTETVEENAPEKYQKIVQYLQKAYRISTQEPSWEVSIDRCKIIIELCSNLSEAQKVCSSFVSQQQGIQHLNSAKLALRGVLSKVKKTYTNVFGMLDERLVAEVKNLEAELIDIEKEISNKAIEKMKKCCSSLPTSRLNPVVRPKTKFQRECRCYQENNQPKSNIKMYKTNPQSYSKLNPVASTANKKVSCTCQEENQTRNKKTWLEVLRASPGKVATTKSSRSGIACSSLEKQEETTRRIDEKETTKKNSPEKTTKIAEADENFLWKLMEINRAIQAACARGIEQKSAACRVKSDHFQSSERKSPRKGVSSGSTNLRNIPISDDDKFNLEKPRNIRKFADNRSTKENERQNLHVKALIKLLESMQSVTNNTEAQRKVLQHLMDVIVQLRDENKILNKLKDLRIDLESKLASLSTENVYLKSKLQTVETERDKAKHLLRIREKENEILKKHIMVIKGTIAGKLDSGINYDVDDYSFELNDISNTIASVPSNNESFDALIRPASSSPAVEVQERWENRLQKREDEDSGIQSNLIDNVKTNRPLVTKNEENILSELQSNVKKTMQDLQTDLKLNNLSLNLSHDTYKVIKGTTARKLDSGINYDVDDYSFELNDISNTIASIPSNNESFDALIRPASSSPAVEVQERENRLQKREDEDSAIQSNLIDNVKTNRPLVTKNEENILSELQSNVKKTMQDLQTDLKLNNLSLNLSQTHTR